MGFLVVSVVAVSAVVGVVFGLPILISREMGKDMKLPGRNV